MAVTSPGAGTGPASGMALAVARGDPKRILGGGDEASAVSPGCEFGGLGAHRSSGGGITWQGKVNDESVPAKQSPPWLDVGPTGDLHVVYYDLRNHPEESSCHVYYARVVDGEPQANMRVTGTPLSFSSSNIPGVRWIGVDEGTDGRVHVTWTDTRFGRPDAFTATLSNAPGPRMARRPPTGKNGRGHCHLIHPPHPEEP